MALAAMGPEARRTREPSMLDKTDWINKLEALHDQVQRGEPLDSDTLGWYRRARTRLLALAVRVQARFSADSHRPRASIRITQAMPVRLRSGDWSLRTLTADLGAGGFAVLVEAPPPVRDGLEATLRLPRGAEVRLEVESLDARESAGLWRIAYRFVGLTEETRLQIEDAMLDGVLDRLCFWNDVLDLLHD